MKISNIDQKLIDAASNSDNHKVEDSLNHGANIHVNDDSPLRVAATRGHIPTLDLLLDLGADIHALNDWAVRMAAVNGKKEATILLLRHGADLRNNDVKDTLEVTEMVEWLDELKQVISEYFKSGKPSRGQCFTADKLHNRVLDACVTDKFSVLIGAPLIASSDKADRQLFQDIWEALPEYFQDQNQDIYMQFAKEGGLNPIVGSHTAGAQRDFGTSDNRVER